MNSVFDQDVAKLFTVREVGVLSLTARTQDNKVYAAVERSTFGSGVIGEGTLARVPGHRETRGREAARTQPREHRGSSRG